MSDETESSDAAMNTEHQYDGSTQGRTPRTRRIWSGLEKVLLVTTVAGFAASAALGITLAGSFVPPDSAAKFDGFFIADSEVSNYIAQQRARNGVEEDSAFASYLLQQGMNVYTYRQSAINQIALDKLIENRAAELGATPSDEEVDEQIKTLRDANNLDDDSAWEAYLDERGLDEQSLRAQVRTNLAEQAMYEKAVAHKEATDEDVADYVKSYRAEGADKHSWRMTFTGKDAKGRAKAALEKVKALGDKLDGKSFSKLAKELSDSPTVADDGGDAGWTFMDGSSAYAQELSDLKAGEVSEVTKTETAGNYGFAFCDDEYTYPEANNIESLKVSALPDGLAEHLRELAADSLWKTDCNVYLTALLADADITYYPIPKGASYNVDMKLAAMASGEGLTDAG